MEYITKGVPAYESFGLNPAFIKASTTVRFFFFIAFTSPALLYKNL